MEITTREFWTLVHGMGFGALYLLAFAGGLAGLYSLRPEWVTTTGMRERMTLLNVGMWGMAAIVWLTVIVGTWIVYPWYRATPPTSVDLKSAAALLDYPRYFLLARESTAEWHKFGMEWKEHVAWLVPIAATMVASLVSHYGARLATNTMMKRTVAVLFVVAFAASAVAGVLGALITKAAPLH